MSDHFGQRETAGRQFRGLEIMVDRFVGHAGLRKMPGDELGLRAYCRIGFQMLSKPQMDRAAPRTQHRRIGRILYQRMLERIDRIGRFAARYGELGPDQLFERVFQLRFRKVR